MEPISWNLEPLFNSFNKSNELEWNIEEEP
jgi:hypothetical protein